MKRQKAFFLTFSAAALVLFLTLWPVSNAATPPGRFFCILCGSRGAADALLNLALFFPFGAGITLLRGLVWSLLGSGLLSGLVETSQLFTQGRHPALADLVFNTLGGGLGGILVVRFPQLCRAYWRRRPSVQLISLVLAPVLFSISAFLVKPQYPGGTYYGQWTHELGSLQPYSGNVLKASVGSRTLLDGRLEESEEIRTSLVAGDTIRFSFLTASPPQAPKHLLAVFNDNMEEVFLIRIRGRDLLFHRQTQSAALRLDQPSVRWRNALPPESGLTTFSSAWQGKRSLCMSIGENIRCDLSGGVEEGWRLLYRLDSAEFWVIGIVSFLFVMALCIPAGAVTEGLWKSVAIGVGLGLLGAFISWLSTSMAPHGTVLVASITGCGLGSWVRQGLILPHFQDQEPV